MTIARTLLLAIAVMGSGSCSESATGIDSRASASLSAVNALEYEASAGLRTFPRPIVVATDVAGNPLPGAKVVFAVGPNGGFVEGAEQTTDAEGRANPINWWLGSGKGTYTLSATSGAHSVTFTARTITGPPAQLVPWAFVNQTTFPGALVSRPPAVRLLDAEGLSVLNAVVDWRDANNVVICQSVTVAGIAQYACGWRPGTASGTYTITAIFGSLRASVSASVVPPPASVSFTTPAAGTGFPATGDVTGGVIVQVRLADGTPAVGYTMRFSSNGVLGSTTGVSDSAGVARTTLRLPELAGPNQLSVTLDTLSVSLRASQSIMGTGRLYFFSIDAGGSHTCGTAMTAGAVMGATVWSPFCWGSNVAGQLGSGTAVERRSSPSLVLALFDNALLLPSSVTSGGDHSCARTDRSVRCWGSNAFGQLGAGSANSNGPLAVLTAASDLVLLGDSHSCALAAEAINCWGYNGTGALGDGTTSNRTTPAPVNLMGVSGRVDAIGAGDGFTCAMASSAPLAGPSKIYCWGLNVQGQVGDGSATNRTLPVLVPGIPFQTVNFPGKLAVGYAHVCAIVTEAVTPGPGGAGGGRTYGKAYCWGNNDSGQLGDGTTMSRTSPVLAAGGKLFYSLTLGGSHSCGVATDGLYCWGANADGQLGSGTFDPGSTTLRPLGISPGTYESLTAGRNHTCGIRSGGVAYCWGRNSSGQLGDGTTTNRAVPTAVAAFEP